MFPKVPGVRVESDVLLASVFLLVCGLVDEGKQVVAYSRSHLSRLWTQNSPFTAGQTPKKRKIGVTEVSRTLFVPEHFDQRLSQSNR